jgi:hypothetical protein
MQPVYNMMTVFCQTIANTEIGQLREPITDRLKDKPIESWSSYNICYIAELIQR